MRPSERASETTSTISISGLEAYDAEATGQSRSPSLSPEAQAAVDALPLGSALLVVRRGPNSGSRFLLDSELTTAGRHPQSDIFLDDVTVSRRHVEFRRGPDGVFTVSDVGSLNGTYVNRERIDAGAAGQRRRGADRQVPAGLLREPAGRLASAASGKVHAQTPSGGAGDRHRRRGRRLLSIGAVLNLLREEFPEVTISKIRFLEAEGLVEPQRTPSGYRKFSRRRRRAAGRTSCGCSGTTICR